MAPRAAHEVVATGIDRTVLARPREGIFTERDMANVSRERRARRFTERPDRDAASSVGAMATALAPSLRPCLAGSSRRADHASSRKNFSSRPPARR